MESLSWERLQDATHHALGSYTLRGEGQVPSTSPDVSLPTDESASSSKRVLLYRDTNAWCPFCERVWLALLEKGVAYDTVFIDLRDKPDWYKAMIPTAQVPAAYIDGELVWESAKILEKFEAAFPEPPLMPTDAAERAHVETVVQEFEATEGVGAAGYRFLRGAPFGEPVNEEKVPEMRVGFEAKLRELEASLGVYPGPYFGTAFGVADICAVPALERLAANLGFARGFDLRTNPEYPKLAAWFAAMDTRPAYQEVKTDDETHNLVVKKIFGMQGAGGGAEAEAAAVMPTEASVVAAAKLEAGAKLAQNHAIVAADILKNSGLESNDVNATAVDKFLLHMAATLAGQSIPPAPAPMFRPDPDLSEEDRKKAIAKMEADRILVAKEKAAGAAALAFVRNRVSAPRDMSAEAAKQFRAAADQLLLSMY